MSLLETKLINSFFVYSLISLHQCVQQKQEQITQLQTSLTLRPIWIFENCHFVVDSFKTRNLISFLFSTQNCISTRVTHERNTTKGSRKIEITLDWLIRFVCKTRRRIQMRKDNIAHGNLMCHGLKSTDTTTFATWLMMWSCLLPPLNFHAVLCISADIVDFFCKKTYRKHKVISLDFCVTLVSSQNFQIH